MKEQAIIFPCLNNRLIGVIHHPDTPMEIGVLIVVGGPQMKSGSHRQFVLLARALAYQNIPVMRFDCQGMGDSTGELKGFEHLNDDINAAIDEFFAQQSSLKHIVLWGLCDAASAALIYGWRDHRVTGLVLANPWVRSESGLAQVYVKSYYWSRLMDKKFWGKLLQGQLNVKKIIQDFYQNVAKALTGRASYTEVGAQGQTEPTHFIDRMLFGWDKFSGKTLLLLSGNDHTAAEFQQLINSDDQWRQLANKSTVTHWQCNEANHTFSSAQWRELVELQTASWIKKQLT